MSLHSDWAYLAAMLEGEGTVGYYRPASPYAQVVAIHNSDRELIDATKAILDKYEINSHIGRCGGKKIKRPHWRVRMTSYRDMKIFLSLVLPYMLGTKKAKAMKVLRFLNDKA